MSEALNVTTPDGDFDAYVARPTASSAATVVVVQEILGVNADMRKICDALAAGGFLTVCPDLFWRIEPGVQLSDRSEAEWKKGIALYEAFDFDAGVADIAATMLATRDIQGASGKVGVLGYCLGGLMTFLAAARIGADAAVAYYGGSTDKYVSEAPKIAHPFLIHLAEEDEYISKDAQRVILAALKDHPQFEIHTNPGCSHAFARNGGKHYDAAAAKKPTLELCPSSTPT